MVKDISAQSDAGGSYPEFLGTASGTAYFSAYSPTGEQQLWGTEGTPEGTHPVAGGCPISCSEFYSLVGEGDDRLFLASSPYSSGGSATALLLASGSPATVGPVFTATPTLWLSNLNYPGATAILAGDLLFWATTATGGAELYVTNGSSGSYSLVHHFESANGLADMNRAGGVVYFWNHPNSGTPELWSTDATAAGTRRIPHPELYPQSGVGIGIDSGTIYFAAQDQNGVEVWSSDGSAAGTRRLTSFADPFARIWHMAASPTRAYFYVEDLSFGQEIWSTDGTPEGSRAVTSFGYFEPFGRSNSNSHLLVAGDRAYFLATTGLEPAQLWVTDEAGSTAAPLARICAESDCISEQQLHAIGSQVFFVGYDSDHGSELWTTDGEPAGTRRLHDGCPGWCEGGGTVLANAGGKLVFKARREEFRDSGIYVVEAPWESAVSLYDELRNAPTTEPYSTPSGAVDGETFYFAAFDSSGGLEPWVSTGSPATTYQLADIVGPQEAGSYPSGFAAIGDTMIFSAGEYSSFDSFWFTEGTSATTRRAAWDGYFCSSGYPIEPMGNLFATAGCFATAIVIDPASNQVTSLPSENCYQTAAFGVVGDMLAAAYNCSDGIEIWRSDGTAQGTESAISLPYDFAINSVFFPVNDRLLVHGGSGEGRLYTLSASMTSLLPLTGEGVYPESGIVPKGEPLGFFSRDSQVWRTDGSPAGTFPVGPASAWLNLSGAVRSPAGYDLIVHNSASATEIWSTDGTAQGTVVRATIWPHYISWDLVPLERAGERLFFLLDSYPDGMSLWVLADGSTDPVRVHSASPDYTPTRALAHWGDRAYFAACDPNHGCELWISDGTAAGTRMVHDIAPGPESSKPTELYVVGDKLYFSAEDGQHGVELWLLPLDGGSPCRANELNLCLEDSRFQVSARWTDFAGRSGDATAVAITGDTGYFWFFDDANVELILKLIDGTGYNGHHWVYYGALSNVEYAFTVTDSETGAAKRYFNPATRFASSGDITAFGPQGAHAQGGPAEEMTRAATPPEVSLAAFSAPQGLPGACVPTSTRFCILDNRFAVTATWRDFAGNTGTANAGTLTDDTGYLWFFNEANVEVVLKMVDAGAFNGHFWVYYGALSNVEYTLTVTDTVAGGSPRIYRNALGQFGSFGDIEAFPAP